MNLYELRSFDAVFDPRSAHSPQEVCESIGVLLRRITPDAATPTIEYLREAAQFSTFVFAISSTGSIIGIGTLTPSWRMSGRRGTIEGVAVATAYEGYGVGRAIMERLHDVARSQRITQLELRSHSRRTAANALYQKLGYERYDTNCYKLSL